MLIHQSDAIMTNGLHFYHLLINSVIFTGLFEVLNKITKMCKNQAFFPSFFREKIPSISDLMLQL